MAPRVTAGFCGLLAIAAQPEVGAVRLPFARFRPGVISNGSNSIEPARYQ